MGREEVRKALEAMDDEAVRAQMAGGDLSAIEPAEITDEERAMIVAAADDYPEVAGFSFGDLTKNKPTFGKNNPVGYTEVEWTYASSPLGQAANYAGLHKL